MYQQWASYDGIRKYSRSRNEMCVNSLTAPSNVFSFRLGKRVEGHAEKEVHSYKDDVFVTRGREVKHHRQTMAKLWDSLTHSHKSGSLYTADCIK
jgi:hypothetical protein